MKYTQELNPFEKIRRAKIKLNDSHPFFAYLVLHLNQKESKSLPMPTMGVDKYGNLHYNKKFVEDLTEEHLKTILCHEIMHVALEHLSRLGTREMLIWNVATDLKINSILVKNGMSFPDDCLMSDYYDVFSYTNKDGSKIIVKDISKKSAEKIYDEIYKQAPKCKRSNLQAYYDSKKHDNHEFGDKDSEGNPKNEKDIEKEGLGKSPIDWKRALAEAVQHSKMKGNVPKGMERLVEELLEPKLNWKALLRKYIIQEIPTDYTYQRRSKHSIATGYYMPATKKDAINVAIAIDTSGSITSKEMQTFLSEIHSIARSYEAVNMKIVVHDYTIHETYDIKSYNLNELYNIKMTGGGGTSHKDVFKWAEKEHARILLCFTDLYSDQDEIKTNINTVWVSTTNQDAPFGRIIKFEEEID